jgi:L-alanine-DL-glutamate epimerase-like enolase superfamily enzyme
MVGPVYLRVRALEIPLRFPVTQASHQRHHAEAIWVEARRGKVTGLGEGCPRPYQTCETLSSALQVLQPVETLHVQGLDDLLKLAPMRQEWGHAAFCAVETALLDLLSKEAGVSVETFLDRPAQRRFRYTTVVGMKPAVSLLDRLAPMGVEVLKVKVGLDLAADQDLLAAVRARLPHARIHLDANNAFGHDADAAIAHLGKLDNFWAVEEPLLPGDPEASARVGRALRAPIILDEGVLSLDDLHAHARVGGDWILNLKVSRVGGVLRALQLADAAQAVGMGLIVGAQAAETSVLTRAGQLVASAIGPKLLALEGGLGLHLLTQDPAAPSLRYGYGGWLNLDDFPLDPTGFGLREEAT